MTEKRPEFVFYHALYHLLAHWAAVVALMVLLLTVGVVIASASGTLMSKALLYSGIWAVALLASYFLKRMQQYADVVNEHLPDNYVNGADLLLRYPRNLVGGAGLAIVFAGIDSYLVYCHP